MSPCPTCGTVPVDRAKENRRAFALIGKLGLSDSERRELAMMLPTQRGAEHPPSFTTLTGAELRTLADWLTGAEMLLELAKQRQIPGQGTT